MQTREQRMDMENRLVRRLLEVAQAHGYAVTKVYDGEEMVRCDGDLTIALATVFSVDECRVYFKRPDQPKGHVAVIVLGNDGWDAIADSSMGEGWDDVMAEVDLFVDALEAELCGGAV